MMSNLWVQGINVSVVRSHYDQTCVRIDSRTALHSVSCLECPLRLSRVSTQEVHTAIIAAWGTSKNQHIIAHLKQ